MRTLLDTLTAADLTALAVFLMVWILFEFVSDFSSLKSRSLGGRMERTRTSWMTTLAARDLRMVDTMIINGLQQGSAFFASTAILAIGGGFALLGSTDLVLEIYRDLPLTAAVSRSQWEIKALGLILIFTYSFFKFGWAYRLFNYCSIMIGAIPQPGGDTTLTSITDAARSAGKMNILAGRHFNSGLRSFFFAMGYMGWFIGPRTMIVSTLFVLLVLIRRQFLSQAVKTLSPS